MHSVDRMDKCHSAVGNPDGQAVHSPWTAKLPIPCTQLDHGVTHSSISPALTHPAHTATITSEAVVCSEIYDFS